MFYLIASWIFAGPLAIAVIADIIVRHNPASQSSVPYEAVNVGVNQGRHCRQQFTASHRVTEATYPALRPRC